MKSQTSGVAAVAAAVVGLGALGCSGSDGHTAAFRAIATEQQGALLSAAYLADGSAIIAGGAIGGGEALLLRWDGRALATIPTPNIHALWWVHALEGHAYLAGEGGGVHRLDGASLAAIETGAPVTATLFGIWGTSDDDLWAVGGSFSAAGAKRVIRRLTGGQWVAVDSPAEVPAETTYFKVWGTASDNVWIVGDGGVVLHWDGTSVVRDARVEGAERLLTVHGCDAQNVWIVGGTGTAEVRAFDGQTWRSVAAPGAEPLSGVACRGGDVIIAGAFAYAARIAGGTTTILQTPKEVSDLIIHGVARSAGHTLLVGGDLLATGATPFRGFILEQSSSGP
ncbi:MAG TPA: hypothetical protein VFH73_26930 [Polyangia bacterium]|nr:hypothetical protein [Polyangia bacterium]